MLINVFMFVPNILLRERFSGSLMAIALGVLIGSVLLFAFINSLNRFPKLAVSEILEVTPGWFRYGFLSFFSAIFIMAGAISLLAFNNVIIRFINPHISGFNMIAPFVVFLIIILIRLKSDKILYTLEIILVLNIPLVLLIVFEAYTNNYLSINSVLEVGTHFFEFPSWSAISAATFIFSGYANMVVFNRVFEERINLKRLWFIPILGLVNLVTSVLIPIGFWGADGVGDLTFPWISTADALHIKYGPVERLITVFILLYISISLLSVTIHWHVALLIIRSILKIERFDRKKRYRIDLAIVGSIGLGVFILQYQLREKDIFILGEMWLNIRFPSEVFLVVLMFFLARRKRI